MYIEFKESGESPEIGVFTKGEKREVSDLLGQRFKDRGLAKAATKTKAEAGEVKSNGNE